MSRENTLSVEPNFNNLSDLNGSNLSRLPFRGWEEFQPLRYGQRDWFPGVEQEDKLEIAEALDNALVQRGSEHLVEEVNLIAHYGAIQIPPRYLQSEH